LPVLRTEFDGVVLRELTADDAEAYHALLVANREHLTRFGDYRDEVSRSLPEVRRRLAEPSGQHVRYGIHADGRLVGRVDLIAVEPPRYGLGYLLDGRATGRGYATGACRAVIEFAVAHLRATDVFAGVTHGNAASVAVLRRLGLGPVADFDTYTRYHRQLRAAEG
jgi:RimJ/RimL family protein N-acetyltransferase